MTRSALVSTTPATLDRGLLVLRIAAGSVFMAHGLQKLLVFGVGGTAGFLDGLGVPFAGANAVALIGVETLGGLALLAGSFTRTAAALLAFAMTVAVVTVHLPAGYFLPNGAEFALTMLLMSLTLTQTGPGRYSVDARMVPAEIVEPLTTRRAA